jgi:hypothetical protein
MNYERIYSEFIANRSGLNPSGYVERHHILPRCLGGKDGTANLIDLSAEDHFFAHLLLAKIHGGKLASALQLLVDTVGVRWSKRLCGRRAYGLGKRLATRLKGEAWTAEGNPLFNSQSFKWVNFRTGEKQSATLYDMHRRFGSSRASWTGVATGYRNSIGGWRLQGHSPDMAHSEKGRRFEFVNRDGRTFEGTQGEFAATHGLNLASASRIVRHESVTRCGWRLKGVSDRPHNYAKDGLPAHQTR